MKKYDLAVIGGGPGGYEAALYGASQGLTTALFESSALGGTCLNRGCVPTKLFLGSTGVVSRLAAQSRLKLARGEARFSLPALQKRKQSVIRASGNAMLQRLNQTGVDFFQARASLQEGNIIQAKEQGFECRSLILATGSKSGYPESLKPDHKHILTSTDALELEQVPDSLCVIGAGPVGLELAQIFSRLGTGITIVEARDRICPQEDPLVSRELASYFKRQKWRLFTRDKVSSIARDQDLLKITLDSGTMVEARKCLLALGRVPCTQGLNPGARHVQLSPGGWISINQNLEAAENLYAVGDVNGVAMYAHSAAHQARYAVSHILGRAEGPYPFAPPPSCIHGSMEVIRTGLRAEEMRAAGMDFQVSLARLASNTISQSHGSSQGFIQVFWHRDQVAGITGTGCNLSSLITLAQVICDQKWTREQAGQLIFAHPTLDEALREALLAPLQESNHDEN